MTSSPASTDAAPAQTDAPEPPGTGVRPVSIGGQPVGGARLPVVAPLGLAGDLTSASLRSRHGREPAADAVRAWRESTQGPLVVEPFSVADLPVIAELADGVLVGPESMQDFRLLAAAGRAGVPVVLQRGSSATVAEWLSALDYLTAGGCDQIVLCESGSRTYHSDSRLTLDLSLVRDVRARTGRPVLVDVTSTPDLAGAAVAAGADGVLLSDAASEADVALAAASCDALAPVVRTVTADTVAGCRGAIDRVDATLATLLEYRGHLAAQVQRLKPVGGFAGRDPQREREIVEQMAPRAPRLGPERLTRVMQAVIETSLDAAEQEGAAAR